MRVSTLFLTPFTKMLREDGRSFRALKLRLVNEPGNVTTNSKYTVVHKSMKFMIKKIISESDQNFVLYRLSFPQSFAEICKAMRLNFV